MFTLKNITIQYGLTPVLHYDGELHFYNHNLILLTGLSGCGKSSLLHLIAGILGKNDAHYDFYDHDHQLSEKEIQDFRLQKIAYVSQDHPLFENNTVKEKVLRDFGMELADSAVFEQALFILKEMRNQCAHLELITRFKIKGKPSLNYFNDIKAKAGLARGDLFYIDVLKIF